MPPQGAPFEGSGEALAGFLTALLGDGRVTVYPFRLLPNGNQSTAVELLEKLDTSARQEAALDLTQFNPETALWSAIIIYHIAQFTVFRDAPTESIKEACAMPHPGERNPETDWSADLTFRHLPALYRVARHLSNADPLLDEIKR